MKKKNTIILLSLLIILVALISACTVASTDPPPSDTQAPSSATTDETKIKELENQILLLIQSQELSGNDLKQQIANLTKEIEKLKETAEATDKTPPNQESTETQAPSIFKYTLENGKATITSINSNEEAIVIPSTIDGYQIYSIGSEAIASSRIKMIVISDGIEKLDWFAFRNCTSLSSITIPSSVSSIGYGAFDNTSKNLTINCVRDSFAHRYAQSYGITYDIT